MISTKSIEEAKKMIKSSKRPTIVLAQDPAFNRKVLEYGKFDVLMSPERLEGSSSLKQSNSGLNEIVARISKKNRISIGIDFDEVKSLGIKEKLNRLIKIRQNIEICRSVGAKIFTAKKSYKDVLLSLGASTKQADEATQYF